MRTMVGSGGPGNNVLVGGGTSAGMVYASSEHIHCRLAMPRQRAHQTPSSKTARAPIKLSLSDYYCIGITVGRTNDTGLRGRDELEHAPPRWRQNIVVDGGKDVDSSTYRRE